MIRFQSVSKRYADGTQAVTDLDLTVPSDGITVFVGPSGCGKTTTLRLINRMLEPTSGEIIWDDTPIKQIKKTTLRRQMGYVIQNGGLFPHRTIAENIATVPTLLGWDDVRTTRRVRELLDLVGLDQGLGPKFPAQLSGGQQQRVGVARALAADPDLLLMDEPFSAVDPVVRADLQQLVRRLQRELNKTIVMITHDMDEAITMGDRVAVMRAGRLVQFDTPQEILDHPADDFVADFAGRDRGYRALTFADGQRFDLRRVRTVRNPDHAYGPGDDRAEPVLIVDAETAPTGWADPKRSGKTLGLGEVFDIETASLRDVLEAALTSPVGLAVGVHPSGRYAGTVPVAEVMDRVRTHRAAVEETAAQRRQDAEEQAARERAEAERRAAEAAAEAERRAAEENA